MDNTAQAMDILENHLPEIESEFDYINSGGCGIMAEIIAEQLEELNVDYSVACKGGWNFDDDEILSVEKVNQYIDEEDKIRVPNSHVIIKVGKRYFDSSGEVFPTEKSITALIDRETISRMNDMDCWNSCFDRSQKDDMRVFTGKIFKGTQV